MGIRSLSSSSISTGTKRSKVWDQSAQMIPTSGMIARYETPPSSGSTWVDTVGGYNLTLSGTTYNSSNGGNLTMGNGSNSSLTMNGTSNYTVSIWAKPTSVSGTSYSTMLPLFGFGNSSSPGSYIAGFGADGIYINGYDCVGVNASGGTPTTNTWKLYTFLMGANPNTTEIYTNSTQLSSGIPSYNQTSGTGKSTPFTIGNAGTLNTNNFSGYIGAVFVWNRKLTATEVGVVFTNTRARFGV